MILVKTIKVPTFSGNNYPCLGECVNEIGEENLVEVIPNCSHGNVFEFIILFNDKNIYTCPNCGHDISNTFTYCPNCAHKMDTSVDAPLKCPNCTKDVAYTYTFCPDCGTKLK